MKKVYWALIAVLISHATEASHILGGQIWYEFISTTGLNSTYKIHLDLYREATGVGLGSNTTVTVNSSIGSQSVSTQNVTLFLSTPEYTIGSNNCGSTSFTVKVNEFEGNIVIPNNANTTIFWQSCCRPFGIDGLANSSGSGFYFEARINLSNPNVRAHDNSVAPAHIGILRLIQGIVNQVSTPFTEVDNDSVFATLKPAKEYNATTGSQNLIYAAGYSPATPIHSDSLFPFTLDSNFNGFSVRPTVLETSVVSYRVDNYVWDTAANAPYRIGYINIDIPVTVSIQQTSTSIPILVDSYTSLSVTDAVLTLDAPIFNGSLTNSLSEFGLHNVSGGIVQGGIVNISLNSGAFGLADSIGLTYNQNLTSGLYSLKLSKGTDSTTLIGECGRTVHDTSFFVSIPFASSAIKGNLTPYSSGYYSLTNGSNIDSVMWIVDNGAFQINSSNVLVTSPNDSIEVTFSSSQVTLKAVRFGTYASDTLAIGITPTGIGNDENTLTAIKVAPNPNEGYFTLDVFETFVGASYEVVDGMGRAVERGVFTSTTQGIDLTGRGKGVYRINIRSNTDSETVVVIVH